MNQLKKDMNFNLLSINILEEWPFLQELIML